MLNAGLSTSIGTVFATILVLQNYAKLAMCICALIPVSIPSASKTRGTMCILSYLPLRRTRKKNMKSNHASLHTHTETHEQTECQTQLEPQSRLQSALAKRATPTRAPGRMRTRKGKESETETARRMTSVLQRHDRNIRCTDAWYGHDISSGKCKLCCRHN